LFGYDEAEGRSYLHLGGAYFLNTPPRHATAFRSIPEIFVGQHANATGNPGSSGVAIPGAIDGTPFFVNTGLLTDIEHVHTLGLEALWVYGPFSVQAESMVAVVDQATATTAGLAGTYLQVGYFLTGEHRPYDRVNGAIDRVKPFEDFFWVNTEHGRERGIGAWEVAMRFSNIDLNDGNIAGGVMNNVTGGVNWYCNPYCKVVFNYIHSWRESPTGIPGEANAFALRTQMDF
jgi:phosphate-selective porin OprO/OprP